MYYYPQQNQYCGYPVQGQINGLKGRPVSSLEEARAAQIDFDGSMFIFPDVANKRIYTKQINMDGTANLSMYELVDIPTDQVKTDNFVTREEFQSAMTQIKEAFDKPTSSTQEARPQFNF